MPPLTQNTRYRQIVGLDVLRMGAALLVLVFHLLFWTWQVPCPYGSPNLQDHWFAPWIAEAWVGVEIFFVLSGFVIAYSIQGEKPSQFLRRRLLRLLPAALICASLTGAFRLLNHQHWSLVARLWSRSVTLSPVGPWIDGSYWTLPIEVAFYLLVLLTLCLRHGRYLNDVMAVLGVSSSLALVCLFSPGVALQSHAFFLLGKCFFPPSACCLLGFGPLFALGVLGYAALVKGIHARHVAALPFCLLGSWAAICWRERDAAVLTHRPVHYAYPLVLWTAAMLLLMVSVWWNEQLSGKLGTKMLARIRFLGLTTYPLYLLHAEMGERLMRALTHRTGVWAAFVSVSGLILALASVIAAKAEPPVRRWFLHRLDGKKRSDGGWLAQVR